MKGDQLIENELIRQSQANMAKDINRLLGVVRSSMSSKAQFDSHAQGTSQVMISDVDELTGNLDRRKRVLEDAARKVLGTKYDFVYQFIREHSQEDREQLFYSLDGNYEKEVRLVEIIISIEEFS